MEILRTGCSSAIYDLKQPRIFMMMLAHREGRTVVETKGWHGWCNGMGSIGADADAALRHLAG